MRHVLRSVLGQGVAQGVNAVAGILRIPILILALGPSGYGTLVLVLAFMPWLMVVPTGVRHSLRVMGARALHSPGEDELAVLGAHLRESRRLGRITCLIGLPGAALVAVIWPDVASPAGKGGESFLTLAALVLLSVSTFRGTVYTGWLEVHSRNGLVNLLAAASGIGGLILSLVLWRMDAPFLAFAVAGLVAATAPAWFGWLLGRRLGRPVDPGSAAGVRVRETSRRFASTALATMGAAGISPFVIGALLGSEAVAVHAVAARLVVVVTIIPTALVPLLWNRQARLPAQSHGAAVTSLDRILGLCILTGAVTSVLFAAGAPRLGDALGGESMAAPLVLYCAFALHGFNQFLFAPLSATLTGPRGLAYMTWTTGAAAVVATALSVPAALYLGVSGPVWAIAVTFGAMMLFWLCRARRHSGLEDHQPH